MSAHRYWRIRGLTLNGSLMAASDIEFHDVRGGVDLTDAVGSGGALASSYYSAPDYQPSNAFDGSTTSPWASSGSTAGAEWIGFDFGSGNAKDVVEIVYRARDDTNQSPSRIAIEYSDDASTWVTKWKEVVSLWSSYQVKVFQDNNLLAAISDPQTHRYWRIRGLALNSGGLMGASHIEMYETVGGTNVCTGGTAISSTMYSGSYLPQYPFDSSFSGNAWVSSGGTDGVEWIGYDFGSGNDKAIIDIVYVGRDGGSSSQSPWYVAIEYSDDGSAWTTHYKRYLGEFDNYTVRHFHAPTDLDVGANPHNYWRIEATGSSYVACAELELRSLPSGPNIEQDASFSWASNGALGGYPEKHLLDKVYPPADNRFIFNALPGHMDFHFDTALTIDEFTWYARQTDPTQSPSSGTVYHSDDGSTWSTAWTFSFGSFSAGEPKTATNPDAGASTEEMVGSASGTGTASGVGAAIASGYADGHAVGTSTVTGRMAAIGTISAVGVSGALGVAHAVADASRPTVGHAAGTSLAQGRAVAIGTISAVGSAVATSTADSGSRATGIIATVGSAAGTSTSHADMSGRQQAVGSAAATSTADAGGSYAPSPAVGRSNGISTVTGVGQRLVRLTGSASATSEAIGHLAGVRAVVGSAAGQGSAIAVTDATRVMAGSAAGTSAASGAATGLAIAVAAAAATSSASGTATALAPAKGSSAAVALAAGIGRAIFGSVGASAAQITVSGVSVSIASAVGSASATSTATGRIAAFSPTRGTSTGGSTTAGVATASTSARGRATGISLATAFGVRVGPGVETGDLVTALLDDWLVQVTAPDDPLVVVAVDDPIVVVANEASAAVAA